MGWQMRSMGFFAKVAVVTALFTCSVSTEIFAQESTVGYYPLRNIYMQVNQQQVEHAKSIRAIDPASGEMTTYTPIWYVMQILKNLGIQQTWNGVNWNLELPPNVAPKINLQAVSPGIGEKHIYVNGVLYENVHGIAYPDPYSGVMTEYMPIWYVMHILQSIGFNSTWTGYVWNVTPPNSLSQTTTTSQLPTVTKLSFLEQFESQLGIVPNYSGTDTFTDVSDNTPAFAAVNAALVDHLVTPDSSTYFGANDPVSTAEVAQWYWNYKDIGHAEYEPGETPTAWASYIGLTTNVGDVSAINTVQATQLLQNIQALQQGYRTLGTGNYQIVYPVADEYDAVFKGETTAPPSGYQSTIIGTYRMLDDLTVQVSNGEMTVQVPGLPDTSNWAFGSWLYSGDSLNYSLDNGSTWMSTSRYDSNNDSMGGTSTPPDTILLRTKHLQSGIIVEFGDVPAYEVPVYQGGVHISYTPSQGLVVTRMMTANVN